ncbi:hypothetical protein [Nocardia sp. NPDC052566]|uniref:hypothetical protein n=1 Tax=Nocardia sp. NPDC052566 TaxID=3364330 RepID=UPI0037C94FF0
MHDRDADSTPPGGHETFIAAAGIARMTGDTRPGHRGREVFREVDLSSRIARSAPRYGIGFVPVTYAWA